MDFFGTIKAINITANSNNIQTYSCDVESLTSGEFYNNCIMHFHCGIQSYPFIGQRVQVFIISNNNYICIATSAQVYNGLDIKDVAFGRLTDDITIKFTKDDIIIGLQETTKNVIIKASTAITLDADVICSGKITVTNDIVCSGNITGQNIEGINDVISGGISGKNHKHTSSTPNKPTSPPIP